MSDAIAAPTIAPILTLELPAVVAAVLADKSRYSENRTYSQGLEPGHGVFIGYDKIVR